MQSLSSASSATHCCPAVTIRTHAGCRVVRSSSFVTKASRKDKGNKSAAAPTPAVEAPGPIAPISYPAETEAEIASKVVKEWKSLGMQVVEQNVRFSGPEDLADPFEGSGLESLGAFLETFALPVVILAAVLIGVVAASTYNNNPEVYLVTATGPETSAVLVPVDEANGGAAPPAAAPAL